jgi:hypothetical protein
VMVQDCEGGGIGNGEHSHTTHQVIAKATTVLSIFKCIYYFKKLNNKIPASMILLSVFIQTFRLFFFPKNNKILMFLIFVSLVSNLITIVFL